MDKKQIERTIRIIEILESFVDDSHYDIIVESRFTQEMLRKEKEKLDNN